MQKFSRPGVILMTIVVAIITSIVVANAAQTFATPNAAFISYSLASLSNSAPITLATNRSVLVMGCCTTASDEGVGQVSLQHVPSTKIVWFGLETTTPATITSGSSATPGTHIVYIDASRHVDIQVASGDTILLHSSLAGLTLAGNVTLVW